MDKALRYVCRTNLLKALEQLKQHGDPSIVAQATMAEVLFCDLEQADTLISQSVPLNGASKCNDNTNYEKYKLLRGFGLSPDQLIDVARCDGLHELRVTRMLRTTFGLSLDDATRILNAKEIPDKDNTEK